VTRAFTPDRKRLTALRLAALGIDSPSARQPTDAVRHQFAMQSQDYASALWSIGLRTPKATVDDVEAAQASGAIVRSWPMRGTLHFVAAEDLGWMLSLTGERMIRSAAGRRRQLGLGEADFEKSRAIVRDRLSGGRVADRKELLAAFDDAGLSTEGQRGVHLLGQLSQEGVIVLHSQTGFALLDEWVSQPTTLEPDDALREFARRYFRSHGPATVKDFSWWSSLTLTQARRGIELARDELDELEVDGVSHYLRPGLEPASAAVHLLPGFDEYLLGYSDRSAQLAGAATELIVPGGNGVFLPTIVVNGEVVGSWRRAAKRDRVVMTLISFGGDFSARTRAAIGRAARRYGEFLKTEVEVAGGD
jgi:hypothetical protein